MTEPPTTLEQDGLRLDAATPDDVPAVQRVFVDDPDVLRFVAWRPKVDAEDAARFLAQICNGWEQRRWSWFARRDGVVVGTIIAAHEKDEVEISYTVTRAAWRTGVATAMVEAVSAWALGALPIRCVRAFADAENVASHRVLEKAGFALVAALPKFGVHNVSPDPRDCVRYERAR